MPPLFLAAITALVIAQFAIPRQWAFVPILIAVFHLGNIEVLGNFTPVRLMMICGLLRAGVSGDLKFSFSHPIDKLMALFAFFAMVSGFGHHTPWNPFIERLGLVLDIVGTYLYARAYFAIDGALRRFAVATVWVILPFALMIGAEKITQRNSYTSLGSVRAFAGVRDGKVRAQAAFSHPILAGTAGAVCFPVVCVLWRKRKKFALLGMAASVAIVVSSASSGPLAAFGASVAFLWFWKYRYRLKQLKIATVILIVLMFFLMNRPIWYIITYIDLVGGSTSYHRALLMDRATQYLSEWWLIGTDYTRHWMPFGVSWSDDHCDVTNYYLRLGVVGGLPLLLLLVGFILKAYSILGLQMKKLGEKEKDGADEFVLWCLGVAVLAHALSFISVSYFDQIYALFYLLLGVIASVVSHSTGVGESEGTS